MVVETFQRNVKVKYQQDDTCQVNFQSALERVILLFTLFGSFEDDGKLRVLSNLACALRLGGLVIFRRASLNRFLGLYGFSPAS